MPDTKLLTIPTILSGLILSGCAAIGASPDTGLPPPPDCGALALQDRVGQPVTGQSAEDLLVGGEPVATRGLVRVVAPGQAITMDFNPERLTIETDEAGNLVRAQCN